MSTGLRQDKENYSTIIESVIDVIKAAKLTPNERDHVLAQARRNMDATVEFVSVEPK